MGRHTKLAPGKPVSSKSPPNVEEVERINALLEAEQDRVESLQASITATIAEGEATPAMIRESNGIARSVATLSAELRQRDKHVGQLLDRMTPDDEDTVVREYLLELPRPRRRAFLELLQGLEDDNDLLAL